MTHLHREGRGRIRARYLRLLAEDRDSIVGHESDAVADARWLEIGAILDACPDFALEDHRPPPPFALDLPDDDRPSWRPSSPATAHDPQG